MDNLTHSLTGLALARTGLDRTTPGATLALVVASNLPDIDVVTWLAGTTTYFHHHRDLTHSVLGAPLLALGLALLLRAVVAGARLLPLLACSVLGVAAHVFMDLWTSYGTRVLSPFDHTWYTWDLVFIIDPYVLLLLLGCLLVPRASRLAPRAAVSSLVLVLAYVGARGLLHAHALEEAVARVPAGTVVRAAALPTPLQPTAWRVLVDAGNAYWTGTVYVGGGAPALVRREKRPESAAVLRARQESAVAAFFLQFTRFPWLEVAETPEGTEVTWSDLRFERYGQERFATKVLVGRDGRIRREAFRF
jgi:inner membrane protein